MGRSPSFIFNGLLEAVKFVRRETNKRPPELGETLPESDRPLVIPSARIPDPKGRFGQLAIPCIL